MKKTLFGLGLFIAFSMIFMGCPSPNSAKTEELSLTEKIAKAEGSIDFENIEIAEDAAIDSKVTIKNLKLGGKTLTINASDTVLENVSNAVIIISEDVGDGNVTISGCKDISKLTINGGGANSVHITDSEIDVVEVKKESVRVALEGTSNITTVSVSANNTKLESNENTTISKLTIKNDVEKITIGGGTIEKVEVEESSDASPNTSVPKIIIADKIEIKEVSENVTVTIDKDVNSDDINIPENVKTESEQPVIVSYTVSYKSDYGTLPEAKTITAESKLTSAYLPVLEADAYVFEGWYIGDKAITAESEYSVTSDITLTAKWSVKNGSAAITVKTDYKDVNLTYTKNGSKYTFTADAGYAAYAWIINDINIGITPSENNEPSNTFILDLANLPSGNKVNSDDVEVSEKVSESDKYHVTVIVYTKDAKGSFILSGIKNVTITVSE